jgi:NAD(P)H-nitrite reductase large subunit
MTILTSKGVEEFLGEDKVTAVMAGGEKIEADLFISAFGVRANTKLAVEAGIPLGETRAIKTNGRMETDVKDVYAVGDCAEAPNIITHRPMCAQLGTIAVVRARSQAQTLEATTHSSAASWHQLLQGCLRSKQETQD